MDLVTLLAAAAEEHRSETPFYIAGGVLAAFAVIISIVGFVRPSFPSGNGGTRAVMGVSVLLVGATMFLSVWIAA
jgi:hypothetical protein